MPCPTALRTACTSTGWPKPPMKTLSLTVLVTARARLSDPRDNLGGRAAVTRRASGGGGGAASGVERCLAMALA